MDLLSVYDILLGRDGEDMDLIREGVMPEFVSYRSGPQLQGTGRDAPMTHFGPKDRATIQGVGVALSLFIIDCSGTALPIVLTPYIHFDRSDAGMTYTLGVYGQQAECTITATGKKIPVPVGGLLGVLLKEILGMGVEMYPFGRATLELDARSSNQFTMSGSVSIRNGASPPNIQISGQGGGLLAEPSVAKLNVSGLLGAKAELSVVDYDVPVFGRLNVSMSGYAGMSKAMLGEMANAAAVVNSRSAVESSLALSTGYKVGVEFSADLKKWLLYFGVTLIDKSAEVKKLDRMVTLSYDIIDIDDDGNGNARVKLAASNLINSLFKGREHGFTTARASSLFGDPAENITYDPNDCRDDRQVVTPIVGCINNTLCAWAKQDAILCGGDLVLDALGALGNVGELATGIGRVEIRNRTGSREPSSNPITVSLTGDPFTLEPETIALTSGDRAWFMAKAQCNERGISYGHIVASVGQHKQRRAESFLICRSSGGESGGGGGESGGGGGGSGGGIGGPGQGDTWDDGDRLWGDDSLWGDPYITTADGFAYTYIASGDYILQRIYDDRGKVIPGLEVQARFLPGFDVSWPYSAAIQVGGDVVELSPAILGVRRRSMGMEVRVNGEYLYPPAQLGQGGSWPGLHHRLVKLPSGGYLYVNAYTEQTSTFKPRSVTIIWPENSVFRGYGVRISVPSGLSENPEPFMDFQFIRPTARAGLHERGMMGNNDGNPHNDLIRRNGQALDAGAALTWTGLYVLFGGDWLVRPHECLFSDGCSVIKPDFPTTAHRLTPEQRAYGEAACAHLVGFYREACINDVGLTGRVDMVREYYARTEDLNALAERIVTPGAETGIYALTAGRRERMGGAQSAYRLELSVTRVSGSGGYILTLRPPRGATARFAPGFPAAGQGTYTGEGDLHTAVEVLCEQADPNWSALGDAWTERGVVQLWSQDPLSGFAKTLLSELPILCLKVRGRTVDMGGDHALALDEQGRLWAWGSNYHGQLGIGTSDTYVPTLAQVDLRALGGAQVVAIAAGQGHSLALDDQGRVWAWGLNHQGQLGDGTNINRRTPVQVDLSALGEAKVVAIEAGKSSYAFDDQGRLWDWGSDRYGMGGYTMPPHRYKPSLYDLGQLKGTRVVAVKEGAAHKLLLDDQGRVWSVGENTWGQLGDGTTVDRSAPVQVDLRALGGAKVVAIAAGTLYNIALDEQGRVWAWGPNSQGQLGDGTTEDRLTPVQVDLRALGGAKVVAISLWGAHQLALDEQGRVWAWGLNYQGQLGDGTTEHRLTPVQVDLRALGGAKVVSVYASRYPSHTSFAMDEQDRLWAWGSRGGGLFGDGKIDWESSPFPVQVDRSALMGAMFAR